MPTNTKAQATSENIYVDKQSQGNATHIVKSFFRGSHRTPVIQYWCVKASESLRFHVSVHLDKNIGGNEGRKESLVRNAQCNMYAPRHTIQLHLFLSICMPFWLFHALFGSFTLHLCCIQRNTSLPEGKRSVCQCLLFKFLFSFSDFPPCNTKIHPC